MRSQRIAIGLVCLASFLLAAIGYAHFGGKAANASSPEIGALASTKVQEGAPPKPSVTPAATAPEPVPFSWRQIEAEDYKEYIANLRSIGCPEQTIRDMIIADVNKLYAARENPLKVKPKPASDGSPGETPEQKLERLQQLRTLQQEKRWVVKELLGIDLPLDMLPSSGARDYDAFEVAFRNLPEEKRDAVQLLQETYWHQSDALKAKYEKKRTPEFVAEHRQLSDSLRQELAKILTPQELEDYDIRTSDTAKQLSSKLASYFRPTEEEFRQLFRAKRDHEETIERLSSPPPPAPPSDDPAERKALAQQRAAERKALEQARSAAQREMNEQLKATLGDERYAEYQRSQDRTYDLLTRLGMRYGLPQETVLQAYDLQKSFKPPPPPVVNGVVQPIDRTELQRQLNEQLTAILGEQAARGYRRVNSGAVPIN